MVLSCLLRGSFPKIQGLCFKNTTCNNVLRLSSTFSSKIVFNKPLAEKNSLKNVSANVKDLQIKNFTTTNVQLSAAHDHVNIWKVERLLSVALIPLCPAIFLISSKGLESILALIIVLHNHWGLEAIVVDYIRPILFGEMAPKIGLGVLYLVSILTLAGLFNLIFNDIGLAESVKTIWRGGKSKDD